MATTFSRNPAETTEERGHNFVTGTATIQPGTFHEPDQPGPSQQSSWLDPLGEGLSTLTQPIRQHPLPAFLIAIGLGAALVCTMMMWTRSE